MTSKFTGAGPADNTPKDETAASTPEANSIEVPANEAPTLPTAESLSALAAIRTKFVDSASDEVKAYLAADNESHENDAFAALSEADQKAIHEHDALKAIETSAQYCDLTETELQQILDAHAQAPEGTNAVAAMVQKHEALKNGEDASEVETPEEFSGATESNTDANALPILPAGPDGASAPIPDEENPMSRFYRGRQGALNDLLHANWEGYDPNGAGMEYLDKYIDTNRFRDAIKKNGNIHFVVRDARNLWGDTTVAWMKHKDAAGNTVEMIGKTNFQSRNGMNPIGEKAADAIVALAKVRGWQAMNLHGTSKEKNELWLAAMKQGMKIPEGSFIPSAKYMDKWNRYQQNNGFDAKGHSGVTEAIQKSAAAPQPTAENAEAPSVAAPVAAAKPPLKLGA